MPNLSKRPIFPHRLPRWSAFALFCLIAPACVLAGCGRTLAGQPASTPPSPTLTPSPTATQTPSPAIVYASSGTTLYAIRESDGAVLHTYPFNYRASTRPAAVNGVLYFTAGIQPANGQPEGIYTIALRVNADTEIWHSDTGGGLTGSDQSLSVANGVVYVAAEQSVSTSRLYALRASDGTVLWHFDAPTLRPPMVVANGILYIGVQHDDGSNWLYAFRAADGVETWAYRFPQGVVAESVVADGLVYVGVLTMPGTAASPGAGLVYALHARDGTLAWHTGVLIGGEQGLVAANGAVYFASNDALYALQADTGATSWKAPGGYGPAALFAGVLYARNQRQIVALRASDGTILWRTQPASYSLDAFAADDLVYAGTTDFYLYAYHARDGSVAWRVKISDYLAWRPVVMASP